MTFDSDCAAVPKRFAFYGVDDIETGRQTMAELANLMNGKATWQSSRATRTHRTSKARRSVRLEAKKHPGIKIIGTFYHIETPQDAAGRCCAS